MMTSPDRQSRIVSRSVLARRFPAPADDAATVVVPYALRDHDIHQLDERHELVEAIKPLSDRYHYRLQSIGHYGEGQYEFCGLSDGFFIVFGDVKLDVPQSLYVSFPDSLQVHVSSASDGEYVFPHGDKLSLEAANTSIFIQPAGAPAAEATFAGCNRYVGVSIHREVLKTLYAGGERELPDILQLFLAGSLQRSLARLLPLRAALLRCLEDVHACPLEGRRRRLFLQSKAVEILCHAIEALEHAEGFGSAEATMLTARGVMKAQRLLEENFVAPPSLEDLAHEVGLSRSGLCAGFRQILGQSVFDYTQDLRMQQALAMLNERDASISQIAYAVGYNRPSSFSVAVQRHFGTTPTELRRRGTLPAN
ncbi:helix-turn-helix transcriptional regulator [Sphingopyxis panaciterrae]